MKEMTPTPWKVYIADKDTFYPGIESTIKGSGNPSVCVYGEKNETAGIRGKANAQAIVSAVNNTFGAGINPEAVQDLMNAIQYALEIKDLWSADQYGTISADHEGEMQALAKMEEKLKAAIEKAKL